MDKIARLLLNWKILLPLSILVVLALWAAPVFLRKVRLYHPPSDRDLSALVTLDRETANRLQTMLDAEKNLLGVPGLQAAIRTAGGQTWFGVGGTVDPECRIPLQAAFYRQHIPEPLELYSTYFVPCESAPENPINSFDRELIPLLRPGLERFD